jgi:hypothetical protein
MLLYVVLIIILILVTLYLYYKAKHQFWSRQPVFHIHNIWYWYDPPGIIQKEKPEMNKFYKADIEFDSFNNISTEKKALLIDFIKNNYLPDKTEKYIPSEKSITNYFTGHNDKVYVSLHYKNRFSKYKNIISCMTTRPLECYINNDKFILYYVDYLCVHQKERKKGIAPITIYSHYVNHRCKHNNTVFFFKREGETTLIVPLMVYKTYFFDISRWDKNVNFEQSYIMTYKLTKQNTTSYMQLLKAIIDKFPCVIVPKLSNLLHLCNEDELIITILNVNKEDKCMYIFRDPHITYEGQRSIELVTSFNDNESDEVFTLGMFNSINMINKDKEFNILLIEDTGDNNMILKIILKRYDSFLRTIASYYFYNYANYPLQSSDVFCIN